MKTELGYFQWCPVTGPEVMGSNRRFSLDIKKHSFTVRVTKHRLSREHLLSIFADIQESSAYSPRQSAVGGSV